MDPNPKEPNKPNIELKDLYRVQQLSPCDITTSFLQPNFLHIYNLWLCTGIDIFPGVTSLE